MKRTFWNLSIAAVAIILIMAASRSGAFGSAGAPPADGETAVKIDNFSFTPNTITVSVGSTVRWTNHDDVPHNVMNEDKSIKSKTLDTNDNFSYTFSKPGTYSYYCSIHPRMIGKIVVQ